MNATRIIHTFTRLACCLLAGALASCIADEPISPASPETPLSPGLHLNLQVNGETTVSTRSDGVDALNENLIETADVFIFNPDETINKHAHADNVDNNETVTVYSGSDWLNNFAPSNSYEVYVIANYKGDDNLENITDLDGLKALVAADPEIVYWEGMNKNTTPGGTADVMSGKTFLMDGHTTVTYDQLETAAEGGNIYTLPVSLYRAAVKVEMTLNFSEAWHEKYRPTGLRIQVANYATRTPAIAGGNPLDPDQRGFQTTPAYGEGTTTEVEEAFSENFISTKGNNGWEGSTVRFYAYINRWDDLVENETMLLIDLPGNLTDNGQEVQYEHNFYKVPIIANTETQAMQRNTFYQINATADMLGTSTIDQPVELTNVQFKTAPWIEDETVVVGGDDDPSFLILSDYHKIIRDADGFDDLGFYSSSPVTVTLASFDSQAAATAAGIDFTYPGNGNTIPAVYFVDKDNDKRSTNIVENDNLTWNENATSGTISLTSPTPTNVTKRYITLKVTNGTDTKYVVVEQYPLEYIQPIQGYYSYRDDFLPSNNATPSDQLHPAVHWEQDFSVTGTARASQRRTRQWEFFGWSDWTEGEKEIKSFTPNRSVTLPTSETFFRSKVYDQTINNEIVYYSFSSTNDINVSINDPRWEWEDWPRVTNWTGGSQEREGTLNGVTGTYTAHENGSSGNSNAMMYFVTITQTSSQYDIAHPLLEEVNFGTYNSPNIQTAVVNSSENDELVSPSFMLASQLGAVSSNGLNWTNAREHCANYVETYIDKNGETQHLNDWRLPTTAEIAVIIEYQNRTPDVMDEVLGGQYYYVSWEGARGGNGSAATGNNDWGDQGTFIRCIRDVKPDDVFLQTDNE